MGMQNPQKNWRVIVVVAIAFGTGAALAWAGLPRTIPDRSTSGLLTAPGESGMREIRELLALLDSEDHQDRSKAWQDLGSVQRTICDRLVVILGKQKARYEPGDARRFAADLLKNCYSPEALPVLVQYIDYRDISIKSTEVSPFNSYPCAMTLRHYPRQAVAVMLKYLAQTPAEKISPQANKLYAWLFIEAYGRVRPSGGGKDASFLIEQSKEMAVGDDRKGNYQRLLDTVKELTKNWPD